MKQGNWIDDLRQREQHYEDNRLPEGLFDDIMAQIPPQQSRPKAALWLRLGSVAAAAAVAIAIGIGSLLRNQTGADATTPLANNAATTAPASPAQTASQHEATARREIDLPASQSLHRSLRPAIGSTATLLAQNTAENQPVASTAESHQAATEETTNNPSTTSETAPTEPTGNRPAHNSYTGGQTLVDDYAYEQQSDGSSMALSLYASGSNGTTADNGGMLMSSYDGYMGTPDYVDDAQQWGLNDAPLEANTTQSSRPKAHHDIPLRFGAAVAVAVNDRLSIESGLVYTRLHSDIDNTMGAGYASYDQTLHYIGVPLKANVTLWQDKNIKVYLKAGVMAEKLVASKISNNSSVDVKSPSEGRLQFSMGAAAGASISIAKPVSLFVEPGVSHYFDNGSNIISLYKDRPTTFDLSIGLRIGF